MNRTWDENRAAINQLWPIVQFTEEEKRLWCDDLSGLDQDMLYDAIRNAKRNHDAVYPQLKWILDAYRDLNSMRRAALRLNRPLEPKTPCEIDHKYDRETRNEMIEWIDRAEPSEYDAIYSALFEMDTFRRLSCATTLRIITYANQRLKGISPQFGRVDDSGRVTPMFTAAGIDGKAPLALRDGR